MPIANLTFVFWGLRNFAQLLALALALGLQAQPQGMATFPSNILFGTVASFSQKYWRCERSLAASLDSSKPRNKTEVILLNKTSTAWVALFWNPGYLSSEISSRRQFSYLRYGSHMGLGQICSESPELRTGAPHNLSCLEHFEARLGTEKEKRRDLGRTLSASITQESSRSVKCSAVEPLLFGKKSGHFLEVTQTKLADLQEHTLWAHLGPVFILFWTTWPTSFGNVCMQIYANVTCMVSSKQRVADWHVGPGSYQSEQCNHCQEAHRLCPRAEPMVYKALALPPSEKTARRKLISTITKDNKSKIGINVHGCYQLCIKWKCIQL